MQLYDLRLEPWVENKKSVEMQEGVCCTKRASPLLLKEISIGWKKVSPLTMICVLWNSNQWFSPPSRTSSPPPLLLRCSSTTFNLGSNCRTKLISYSNVRLGGEALRPTTHLTLPITVSSSCNSLNTAAISTLAPNPAAARRHLTKYGKFNYVYR